MCYFIDNSKISIPKNITVDYDFQKEISSYIVAPQYPTVPIIINEADELVSAKWRFNPALPEDYKSRTIGLNIRSEEVEEKPLFRNFLKNHCIIPINGFFEWKHLENHKVKVKHYLTMKENPTFFLAGLWRMYSDGISFGVLTTASNELMTDIHNSKFRMPICMNEKQAFHFLNSDKLEDFIFPKLNPVLNALNVEPEKIKPNLF